MFTPTEKVEPRWLDSLREFRFAHDGVGTAAHNLHVGIY